MLVAIVSDTHLPRGGRRLPSACLERLREAELILHAGDFVSAGALAEIEALGPPVAAVHGNVDSEEVRARLPETRMVEVAGASRTPTPASSGTRTSPFTSGTRTASSSSTPEARPTDVASRATRWASRGWRTAVSASSTSSSTDAPRAGAAADP